MSSRTPREIPVKKMDKRSASSSSGKVSSSTKSVKGDIKPKPSSSSKILKKKATKAAKKAAKKSAAKAKLSKASKKTTETKATPSTPPSSTPPRAQSASPPPAPPSIDIVDPSSEGNIETTLADSDFDDDGEGGDDDDDEAHHHYDNDIAQDDDDDDEDDEDDDDDDDDDYDYDKENDPDFANESIDSDESDSRPPDYTWQGDKPSYNYYVDHLDDDVDRFIEAPETAFAEKGTKRFSRKKFHLKNIHGSTSKIYEEFLDDGSNAVFKERLTRNNINLEDEKNVELHEIKSDFKIPKKIWDGLYEYQHDGLKWFWNLHKKNNGGILADEMGLGKTIQIIAFLVALRFSKCSTLSDPFETLGPVLLICPATIMFHWVEQFHRWWPYLRVSIYHRSGTFRGNKKLLLKKMFDAKGIIITSYKNFQINYQEFYKYRYHYAILDEGHKIRNPEAQITITCKGIRAYHRVIISGTPMQNGLKELWSIFDFICPGLLGDLCVFMENIADPIVSGNLHTVNSIQYKISFQCSKLLRNIIMPFILKRSKDDVESIIKLPKKTEEVLFCKLSDKQKQLYLEYINSGIMREIEKDRRALLPALIKIRKICNHPCLFFRRIPEYTGRSFFYESTKFKVISSLLKLWSEEENKVLLFTQGIAMLNLLELFMQRKDYKYLRMDGSTPVPKRQSLAEKFNNDKNIFAFLLTTKVGGVGLTLTGADRVIIIDPDWNPCTDVQARERCWRIGQTKDVSVYRLLIAGSIEEKMYYRQIFKQYLSNRILKSSEHPRVINLNSLKNLFTLNDSSEIGLAFHDSRIKLQRLRNLDKLPEERRQLDEATRRLPKIPKLTCNSFKITSYSEATSSSNTNSGTSTPIPVTSSSGTSTPIPVTSSSGTSTPIPVTSTSGTATTTANQRPAQDSLIDWNLIKFELSEDKKQEIRELSRRLSRSDTFKKLLESKQTGQRVDLDTIDPPATTSTSETVTSTSSTARSRSRSRSRQRQKPNYVIQNLDGGNGKVTIKVFKDNDKDEPKNRDGMRFEGKFIRGLVRKEKYNALKDDEDEDIEEAAPINKNSNEHLILSKLLDTHLESIYNQNNIEQPENKDIQLLNEQAIKVAKTAFKNLRIRNEAKEKKMKKKLANVNQSAISAFVQKAIGNRIISAKTKSTIVSKVIVQSKKRALNAKSPIETEVDKNLDSWLNKTIIDVTSTYHLKKELERDCTYDNQLNEQQRKQAQSQQILSQKVEGTNEPKSKFDNIEQEQNIPTENIVDALRKFFKKQNGRAVSSDDLAIEFNSRLKPEQSLAFKAMLMEHCDYKIKFDNNTKHYTKYWTWIKNKKSDAN